MAQVVPSLMKTLGKGRAIARNCVVDVPGARLKNFYTESKIALPGQRIAMADMDSLVFLNNCRGEWHQSFPLKIYVLALWVVVFDISHFCVGGPNAIFSLPRKGSPPLPGNEASRKSLPVGWEFLVAILKAFCEPPNLREKGSFKEIRVEKVSFAIVIIQGASGGSLHGGVSFKVERAHFAAWKKAKLK